LTPIDLISNGLIVCPSMTINAFISFSPKVAGFAV
jgi:hypothetical protein